MVSSPLGAVRIAGAPGGPGRLRPPAGASGWRLHRPGRPPEAGESPRGVTGTPPAGERRGLVPARPANAAVAGPVSAGCGQATAAPGLPPARAGWSVRAVVCHAAGARRPTPPLVAALQWRSFGLSLRPLCCASSPLANPARCVPWDWSPREAFCSAAHPCCSSSWRARKIIVPALLRQGPRRTRLSPLHAMGPRLDTRWCRFGFAA